MSAQGVAVKAAAQAASEATGSATKKSVSAAKRFLINPLLNTAHKIEHRSLNKMSHMSPSMASWVQQHEAAGTDAASQSTKRYLNEQSQLIHYRVTRLFNECRYVFSGQYFKQYDRKAFVVDLRFLTKLLFLFVMMVPFGRQSIYPPIRPDSPLVLALDHKANPNY